MLSGVLAVKTSQESMGYRDLAESLLYEEEGPTLDFKRQQYPFEGASDSEKAEFLKDILAFANAWRRTDAFIYIGAAEVKGGRSQILGIAEHVDDAKLQQFVNSKTNRPVEFSYVPLEVDGKSVALVHVPVQQRPTYLLKNYGGLLKDTVYVRRGSSTDIANPDEIARMGMSGSSTVERAAKLSVFLVAGVHGELVDKQITLSTINAEIPDEAEFPLYGVDYRDDFLGIHTAHLNHFNNENFYSEYAKWQQTLWRYKGVHLAVKNTGNSVARDVKVVFTVNKTVDHVDICEEDDLPRKPSPSRHVLSPPRIHSVHNRPDVLCKTTKDGWRVVVELGKVQAMDTAISRDFLCVAAKETIEIPLRAEIFSDDLSQPIQEELKLVLDVAQRNYSVDDFVKPTDEDS